MSDGYVQLSPDGTGKKTDTSEITREDESVVQRQRIAIGDASDPADVAQVHKGALQVRQPDQLETLIRIADTLEDIRTLLKFAFK